MGKPRSRRYARGPVSRVLYRGRYPRRDRIRDGGHSSRRRIAPPLQRPTRAARLETGLPVARRATPIRSCSGWGLPCGTCCQAPGAPLPHPFTLACAPKGHRRFAFCGTFPGLGTPTCSEVPHPAGVTRHPRFVEPGLSSAHPASRTRRGRPAPWRGPHSTACKRKGTAYLACPRSRSSSRANSIAPISPSTSPSILAGRHRRWNAFTAARPSEMS